MVDFDKFWKLASTPYDETSSHLANVKGLRWVVQIPGPRPPQEKGHGYSPDARERAAVLRHICYEIEQIAFLAMIPPGVGVEANARTESWLLHVRNLRAFFEDSKRSRGGENDDVLCEDFGFPAESLNLPPGTRERLHRRLAHLSYSRVWHTEDDTRWPRQLMIPVLERSIAFALHVLERDDLDDRNLRCLWEALMPVLDDALRASAKESP